MLISGVFPLKVQESRPFRKTVGINWNVQHVRLTKRGLTFSNNPDGSAYQPKKAAPGGVLLAILDGGVLPGSPNPDPIQDQKMYFSVPVFRPVL